MRDIVFSSPSVPFRRLFCFLQSISSERGILMISFFLSVVSIVYFFFTDTILAYGDSESHLNIAKRVVHSLTPGLAQLGGIWLPLPHLLVLPFVVIEPLYRTGLAGSLVSGGAYILSSVYLYKTMLLLIDKRWVAFVCALVFALNPNVLYLQATPMTELVLIVFFILSTYYFLLFLHNQHIIIYLVFAGFYGFCASLSRYDGWFLVLVQAGLLVLLYVHKKAEWRRLEGLFLLFSSLAFLGIFLWLLWDFLILGDPFYFTNSQFSAKSQQNNWLARGELPGYHNLLQSFLYYTFTAMANVGVVAFFIALVGFVLYLRSSEQSFKFMTSALLLVPYAFNILTLYLGQSVIFIPSLTPSSFEWRLFNVRYGVMMVPFFAIFIAYLLVKLQYVGRLLVIGLLFLQVGLFMIGYSKVLTLDDGTVGLSHAKRPDAEVWLNVHYDGGLVLLDDYARSISIIRSGIPMQNVIYVGTKPYWEESLQTPEKYATWVVMQKDDAVWKSLYDNPVNQGRLYSYFEKVYTSEDTLIFRRNRDER